MDLSRMNRSTPQPLEAVEGQGIGGVVGAQRGRIKGAVVRRCQTAGKSGFRVGAVSGAQRTQSAGVGAASGSEQRVVEQAGSAARGGIRSAGVAPQVLIQLI